jgi:hypothetical protein
MRHGANALQWGTPPNPPSLAGSKNLRPADVQRTNYYPEGKQGWMEAAFPVEKAA